MNLLAGDLSVKESFVDAGTVLLSPGKAEVLHGRGVLPTDWLRPVTPDPPHAPVEGKSRQINTQIHKPEGKIIKDPFTRIPRVTMGLVVELILY